MAVSKLRFTPIEAAFIVGLPLRDVQKAIDKDWFDFVPRHSIGRTVRRGLGPAELLQLRIVKDACRFAIFHTEAKKQIHRQLRERMADVLLAYTEDVVVILELGQIPDPTSGGATDGSNAFCPGAPEPLFSDSVRLELEQWLTFDEARFRRCFAIRTGNNECDRLFSWFEHMAEYVKEPVKISEISVDAEGAWGRMTGRLAEATAAQCAVVSDPEVPGGDPVVRGTRISVHLLQQLLQQGATHNELLADHPSLDDRRLKLALLYAQHHPRTGRPKGRPWKEA